MRSHAIAIPPKDSPSTCSFGRVLVLARILSECTVNFLRGFRYYFFRRNMKHAFQLDRTTHALATFRATASLLPGLHLSRLHSSICRGAGEILIATPSRIEISVSYRKQRTGPILTETRNASSLRWIFYVILRVCSLTRSDRVGYKAQPGSFPVGPFTAQRRGDQPPYGLSGAREATHVNCKRHFALVIRNRENRWI
jgi:hypothetical protein